MNREITIALDLPEKTVAAELKGDLEKLPDVRFIGSLNGSKSPKSPQVIVTGDRSSGDGTVVMRVASLRRKMPDANLIVVSGDASPSHVVEVMQAGAAEFLAPPVTVESLAEAIDKIRARLAGAAPGAEGCLFSFVSSKGGLGATVLSVNTAVAMARKADRSVAFIDLSLHTGDSSVMLDVIPQTTIADVCRNMHRLDFTFLRESFTRHDSGLWYLPAPQETEEISNVDSDKIRRVLDMCKTLFDCIIVDCASMGVEESSREVFLASERIFLVTDLSVPAVRNTARLLKTIRMLGVASDRAEVIMNRYIKGGVPSVDEIEKTLGRKLYWLLPSDFGGLISSINKGKPFVQSHAGSALARNICQFTEKLSDPEALGSFRGVKGFLGKAL